mgnify:CR=1 FL=1
MAPVLLTLKAFLLFFAFAFAIFFIRQIVYGRTHHARVLKDGGTPLFAGKLLMDFAYWLLSPIEKLLVACKISPDSISIFCMVLSLIAGGVVAGGNLFAASLVWMFGSAMDALDGLVARAQGRVSKFGEVLDSTVDRVSELAIFSGFIIYYRSDSIALGSVLLALWGSVLTSYISAKGEILRIQLPRGIMRRAERAVYLGVAMFVSPLWVAYGYEERAALVGALPKSFPVFCVILLIGVVSNLSSIYRLVWLRKKLNVEK